MSELEDAARSWVRAKRSSEKAWLRLRAAVIAEKKLRDTSEVQLADLAGVNRLTVRKWLAEERGNHD